jgi:hypothetical protein
MNDQVLVLEDEVEAARTHTRQLEDHSAVVYIRADELQVAMAAAAAERDDARKRLDEAETALDVTRVELEAYRDRLLSRLIDSSPLGRVWAAWRTRLHRRDGAPGGSFPRY